MTQQFDDLVNLKGNKAYKIIQQFKKKLMKLYFDLQ